MPQEERQTSQQQGRLEPERECGPIPQRFVAVKPGTIRTFSTPSRTGGAQTMSSS
jgi:hypothetical protein